MAQDNRDVICRGLMGLIGTRTPTLGEALLSEAAQRRIKPRLFVSYQHSNDQSWCNLFRQYFGEQYELFTDTSPSRKVESDDAEYIGRAIRERYITRSSITVVLCGITTHRRKHVDWEIHATLDKKHALLGIILPTLKPNAAGKYVVPARLYDNCRYGYAHLVCWSTEAADVAAALAEARRRAGSVSAIVNYREKMKRNQM